MGRGTRPQVRTVYDLGAIRRVIRQEGMHDKLRMHQLACCYAVAAAAQMHTSSSKSEWCSS
jgi:hypothetical protein